jgi:hypothetical protein
MNFLLSSPPSQPLSPSERLAAACCIGVAALMCGTACFSNMNTNLHLMDSEPKVAPPIPRTPQSARVLAPGSYRFGISGDGTGFTPRTGEGTSSGQLGLHGRIGTSVEGLELDFGMAFPLVQPYGIARGQVLGRHSEHGPFLAAEAGAAAQDYFGGLSLGMDLDKSWETEIHSRVGSGKGAGYYEAGLGFVFHPYSTLDMVAGLGYRFNDSDTQPNIARAGVNFEFGSARGNPRVQFALRKYKEDQLALLKAGELDAAAMACQKKLEEQPNQPELWELYGNILMKIKANQPTLKEFFDILLLAHRNPDDALNAFKMAEQYRSAGAKFNESNEGSHSLPKFENSIGK